MSQFSRPLSQSNGQANSVLSWSLSVDIHSCLHEVYIPIDENQKKLNTDILESNKSRGLQVLKQERRWNVDRMCNKMVKTESDTGAKSYRRIGASVQGKSILGRKSKCKELGTLFAYSRNSNELNLIEVKQIKKKMRWGWDRGNCVEPCWPLYRYFPFLWQREAIRWFLTEG